MLKVRLQYKPMHGWHKAAVTAGLAKGCLGSLADSITIDRERLLYP